MKKISLGAGSSMAYNWCIGDLVKIKCRGQDVMTDTYSAGVITAGESRKDDKQQLMFALVSVYDFRLQKINKIYSSNLEILSSIT